MIARHISTADMSAMPVEYFPSPPSAHHMRTALIIAGVAVLLVFAAYKLFAPKALAHTLTGKGWVAYFMTGCGYCDKQRELLGSTFTSFVVCTNGAPTSGIAPPTPCGQFTSFPTWYNTKTKETRVGYQNAAALASMAGW
jgi:hypothetical protein